MYSKDLMSTFNRRNRRSKISDYFVRVDNQINITSAALVSARSVIADNEMKGEERWMKSVASFQNFLEGGTF